MPTSSGPATSVARLTLTAPATAATGSQVPVRARVEVTGDAPRIVTHASTSMLLVVRDGRVVGRTTSGSGPDVPLPLRAGTNLPAQSVPTSVALVGCPTGGAPATALPAGDYDLVAVLGYGGDAFNSGQGGAGGSGSFVLVSAPVPVRVT